MAVTTEGIDKAEVTQCVEVSSGRTADGVFIQTVTPLPWVLVRFADNSETNRYVMPTNGGVSLAVAGAVPYRMTQEAMRNTAFPHESDRGPRPTDGDLSRAGALAVHQFGPF